MRGGDESAMIGETRAELLLRKDHTVVDTQCSDTERRDRIPQRICRGHATGVVVLVVVVVVVHGFTSSPHVPGPESDPGAQGVRSHSDDPEGSQPTRVVGDHLRGDVRDVGVLGRRCGHLSRTNRLGEERRVHHTGVDRFDRAHVIVQQRDQ